MKYLRLKAACAVALMLLSLVSSANAYGNGKDRLLARVSERLTSAVVNKLPPSLSKKIVTGVAVASFICGAYVCSTALFSDEQPQLIKKSADFNESPLDRSTVVITGRGSYLAKLQKAIEQSQLELQLQLQ